MADKRYHGAMRLTLILPSMLPLVLLGAACSPPDNASGAGGVSAGEARALDDAAAMLESQQLPAAAIPAAQKSPAPQPSSAEQTRTTGPVKPAG